MSLAADHFDLVEKVAWSVGRRLPSQVDRDELRGVAAEALVRAERAYDPSRGASFKTYAWRRMAGALLDYLREIDPHSRGQRQQMKRGEEPTERGKPVAQRSLVSMAEVRSDVYGGSDLAESVCGRIDILRLIGRLTPRDREIVMRRAAGYVQEEIGLLLGITPSRVSQLEAAARRQLAWAA